MNYLRKLNNKGQSAIEFVVVVIVVFFFLLFYLSLSVVLVTSEYVEYATFMAARTYKSGFSDESYQEQYAREIFFKYLDRISGVAKNPNIRFINATANGNDAADNQTAGVSGEFDVDLFYLPPLFIKNGNQPVSRMRLTTESRLGRDPALNDCVNFFNDFSRRLGLGIDGSVLVNEMDDNGC